VSQATFSGALGFFRRKDHFVAKAVEVAEASTAAGIPNLEKSGNSFPALWDIEKIQEVLPHRYSFPSGNLHVKLNDALCDIPTLECSATFSHIRNISLKTLFYIGSGLVAFTKSSSTLLQSKLLSSLT
jgi:hypothetical protein